MSFSFLYPYHVIQCDERTNARADISLPLLGVSSDFVFNAKFLSGVDFGANLLTTNSSVRRQLTLHNTGRAPVSFSLRVIPQPSLRRAPLREALSTASLGSGSVDGANAASESASASESGSDNGLVFEIMDNWRGTVSGGEFAFVTFLFKPNVEREYAGEIEISAPQGLYCLPIAGVGICPLVDVSTDRVEFGMVGYDFSARHRVTVTNRCALPLKLRLNAPPPVFAVALGKALLPPGASTALSVTFSPGMGGWVGWWCGCGVG